MGILQKFLNWFRVLLGNIPKEIKQKAAIALLVTGTIRTIWESKEVDAAISLFPIGISDEDRAKIAYALTMIEATLTNGMTLVDYIHTLNEVQFKAILIKIASLILAALDDNELKENQYDTAIQVVLSGNKV